MRVTLEGEHGKVVIDCQIENVVYAGEHVGLEGLKHIPWRQSSSVTIHIDGWEGFWKDTRKEVTSNGS